LLGLAFLTVASAAPPAIAETEINYLLGFIESSSCEFYRNGSWYDSKRAQAHLRDKYEMLAAAGQINTAEDFIEKAATKSSLSGRSYQVRCGGGEAVTSSQWLREALARYRAQAELGAPRPTRGAHGTDASVQTGTSVVLHDLDVAVNHLYVFRLTRNGLGLVCRFLGSGAAGQPHDPILVRVDMNASQAADVLRSELGLDRRCDGGILHECHGV
jgi:hypothetical protein